MVKSAQMAAAGGRKRKNSVSESDLPSSSSSVELKSRRLTAEDRGDSTCEIDGPDRVSASCCSSNGSSEVAQGSCSKFVDLELEESVAVEFFATSVGDSLDCDIDIDERRETTPLGEAQAESGELESTAMPRGSNSHRPSAAEIKMPSDAELEEFFAMAEKDIQNKFIDKYNFDIVKDQPLEGRYEWVQIRRDDDEENVLKLINNG